MTRTNRRYRRVSEAEIVGQKYGKLTAIKEIAPDWTKNRVFLCKCDCGNETNIQLTNLKNGRTKSCGCLRQKSKYNLKPGDKFGRLTIVKQAPPAGKKGNWYKAWYVTCDCNNYWQAKPTPEDPDGIRECKKVRQSGLISGDTQSCGCLRDERIAEAYEEYRRLSEQQTGLYLEPQGDDDTTTEENTDE